MSQWVVRLPDRLILLQRPVNEIRVFSTEEVLQFKTAYGAGESRSRIERQHDINSRQQDVTFAYWVVLFPLGLSLEVLCCTVQRATADRILDALWMSMFTNCGDNTVVDLRQVLAADRVTPEQVAAASATGRFVDLGDGDLRRPTAAAGGVDAAAIPVQTVPTRQVPGRELRPTGERITDVPIQSTAQWIRTVGIGGSQGVANANADVFAPYGEGRFGVDMRVAAQGVGTLRTPQPMIPRDLTVENQIAMLRANLDVAASPTVHVARDPMMGYRPAPQEARSTANLHDAADTEQVRALPADIAAIMQQSTVPNIGRGMSLNGDRISPRALDRLQVELQAALMRQQAENRNTHVSPVPTLADYTEFWQPGVEGPQAPPDNDAVDRVDPDF